MNRSVFLALALLAGPAGCAGSRAPAHVCASDRQCSAGSLCAQGRCRTQLPARSDERAPAPATCPPTDAYEANAALPAGSEKLTTKARNAGSADAPGPSRMPRRRWRYDASAALLAGPSLDAQARVYVGSLDGVFHAIGHDGTPRWQTAVEGPIRAAAWVTPSGVSYVGAGNRLVSLSAEGDVRWARTLGAAIVAPPLRGPRGTLYVAANGLYALDGDGNVLWHRVTAAAVRSELALHPDGFVLFGTVTGRLVAVREGHAVWRRHVEASVSSGASVDEQGHIYVGTDLGELFSLDAAGEVRWRVETAGALTAAPAIHPDGFVVVGTRTGRIQAFDMESGVLHFEHATSAPVTAASRIDAEGRIYVGSHDGFMYALDRKGALLWRFDVAHAVGAAVAVGHEGSLILSADDGRVHTLR